MKRQILIAWLTTETTGWRCYTIKLKLRGGETYSMFTHSRQLNDRLNRELAKDWDTKKNIFLLQVAAMVLEKNDVFYDEIEFL